MQNSINITGRLVRNIQVRFTQSGIPVSGFSIACRRDRKDGSGEYGTDFFNCTAWRHKAEYLHKYAKQGDLLIMTGRLQQVHWCDDAGGKRNRVEILVESVTAIERKQTDGDKAPPCDNGYREPTPQEVDSMWQEYESRAEEEDFPF